MLRHSWVEIDVNNLEHNLRTLKRWTGGNFFCPMVKANAYGHGAILTARAIERVGADAIGVALVEEGIELRRAGVKLPILVFAPFDQGAAAATVAHDLTPVLGRPEHVAAFRGRRVDVHLKFNVGMQRMGFDAPEVAALREQLPGLTVRGVCSHLTHGEDAAEAGGPTARQMALFHEVTRGFAGVRHAHKSASLAALGERVAAGDVGARPGIGLHGLPHEGRLIGEGLRPTLTWRSELAAVHCLKKGQSVGYGARWTAPRDLTLGVVPIGYGDGFARRLSGRASVLVGGRRVPVVGSVCMDYLFVDLGDGLALSGEPVVIIGRQGTEQITAAEVADWADTISYEVVTAISARVPRRSV